MADTSNIYSAMDDPFDAGAPGKAAKSSGKTASPPGTTGFSRTLNTSAMTGSNPSALDQRLFGKLDVAEGFKNCTKYAVTRDDRMSADEAWRTTKRILATYDLASAEPGVIMTFLRALFAYHTFNSGSTLQPGRGQIHCAGSVFDYYHIIQLLGNDMRRYFRAYADEIKNENLRILRNYDPRDPVSKEHRDWLEQVAVDRGLQRFMHLAHDSSDACSNLSITERAAIASSKRAVLSSGINTADSVRAMTATLSADKYDSTAGVSVPHGESNVSNRAG